MIYEVGQRVVRCGRQSQVMLGATAVVDALRSPLSVFADFCAQLDALPKSALATATLASALALTNEATRKFPMAVEAA